MKRLIDGTLLLLALVVCIPLAAAQSAREVRKQTEASMLVTGHVLIEQDGHVSDWEVDQPGKLPKAVVGLIESAVAAWKFKPVLVDGQPHRAKARMSLRVVANRQDDGDYQIAIRSGYFGEEAMSPGERLEQAGTSEVQPIQMRPPAYPMRAVDMQAQGTAYLILQINRQGLVEDAFVEQVNLKTVGNEKQMSQMRDMLAKPALAAARKWTFRIPVTGEEADSEYWQIRVPVDYVLSDTRSAGYGQWDVYIPGPRHHAPWRQDTLDHDDSPDAMLAGSIYQVGKGLRLLTPLQQG